MRFYPVDQPPVFEISARGKKITDVVDLPRGGYRVDAQVSDNSFILKLIVVEGNCSDDLIFNELNMDSNRLTLSGLLVSSGCSIIFETDNVSGNWSIALRSITDEDVLAKSLLEIENGVNISGKGRALTMPTLLEAGIWKISATVSDRSFILSPRVLIGDCDERSIMNELDFNSKSLELSTVFRVPTGGCIIYWETNNVDGEWELLFEKINR